jgi:hypothetical protein
VAEEVKQSSVVFRVCIVVVHFGIVLWIMSMCYLHEVEPITSKFLSNYGCEVIRPTDLFASLYVEQAKFWLQVSYACTVAGVIQFANLLWNRRVESVFQGLLLAVLVFLQISDYLQKEWIFQSYQVLTYGV